MKLFKLVGKNFRILFRNKVSALVILLGPLLLIVLVGLAFSNDSAYSVDVGVYSDSFNDMTNSFVDSLKSDFGVNRYNSEFDCIEAVKQRVVHACAIFPADMVISDGKTNEVIFWVDQSNINLAWMVSKSLGDAISGESSELSLSMTAVLLDRLNETQSKLDADIAKLTTLLNENKDLVSKSSSIKDEASSISVPDVSAILNSISALKTDLESVKDDVDGLDGSDEVVEEIDDLIDDVESVRSSLSSVSSDLNKLGSAKDTIVGDVEFISSTLDGSLSKLNSIKASSSDLADRIEGIDIRSAVSIVSPITTKIEPIVAESTHLNYLFPFLLVLVIMLVSVLLASSLTISEKISLAFFRNVLAPTRRIVFTFSIFLTCFLILLIQLVVIMLVSGYFFKIAVLPNLGVVSLVLLALVVLFVVIGMFIGALFNSTEMSVFASVTVCSVFLVLSGIILPLESMPAYIKRFFVFNPFVIGESLLKKSLLFNIQLPALAIPLLTLFGYAVGIFILMILLQKLLATRFVHFSARRHALKRDRDKIENEFAGMFDNIKEGQFFKLDDGTIIKSVTDMIAALESMDDKTFSRYCSKKKNDFANWARLVLKNDLLADELAKICSKDVLLSKFRSHHIAKEGKKELIGLFGKQKAKEEKKYSNPSEKDMGIERPKFSLVSNLKPKKKSEKDEEYVDVPVKKEKKKEDKKKDKNEEKVKENHNYRKEHEKKHKGDVKDSDDALDVADDMASENKNQK